MAKNTFTTLMRRLSQAGFKMDFVRPAILPDWWEKDCVGDLSVLPEIEIRVARFLGLPLSAVRDPSVALAVPGYQGAQLRHARDIDRDRLAPAIHAAMQVAAAVVRSLRNPASNPTALPGDGLAWRTQIRRAGAAVKLDDILEDLWQRSIPVVPIEMLPAPRFQAIACVVEGRPVILLGHRHDEPGRVAFFVAHEAAHIAGGDCTPGQPVVDEEEAVIDNTDMESRADGFATHVLIGSDSVPEIEGADFRQLAKRASELERISCADAGAVIFAWAAKTGDYSMATMAVNALYRSTGARRLVRNLFDRHVDLSVATESDRSLLRCVYGGPRPNAAVG